MRFERMTDDELKRFLMLGTQDKCAALAMQETCSRRLVYEQQDVDDAKEAAYDAGCSCGKVDGYREGYEEGLQEAEK